MDITDIPSKTEFDIDAASKDELLQFAQAHFMKELNGRDKLDSLRSQIKTLLAGDRQPEPMVEEVVNPGYEYCLNPKNNRVLIASDGIRRLVKQGELIPCDKDGNRL